MKKSTVKQLDWSADFVIGDVIEYDIPYSDLTFKNKDPYGKFAVRYRAMVVATGFNDGEFLLDNGIQTTKYGLKSLDPGRWFP